MTVQKMGRLRRIVAAILIVLELVVLLAASAWAIFILQPFGQRSWPTLKITASLTVLVIARLPVRRRWLPRLHRNVNPAPQFFRLGANVLILTLACWLGLIAWSSWCAGGPMPPAKSDTKVTRVLTWNILHGTDKGAPWNRCGWSVRKLALASTLLATKPDILCVQEAVNEQVDWLTSLLVGYSHVGVGRDDGHAQGEFCAIFFDRARFDQLDAGTFWLEEPSDLPPRDTRFGPKRICTWARLRERQSGRALRVFNVHLYLTESARLEAVRIILARIAQGDPTDAVLVTGDFNAPPETPNRLLFANARLSSTNAATGASPPTYQFYGIRTRSLDDVLVSSAWRVQSRRVLDVKPDNTFPSDHFGVLADLMLESDAPQGSQGTIR